MNKDALLEEVMRLPADERLRLGEEVWESLIADRTWTVDQRVELAITLWNSIDEAELPPPTPDQLDLAQKELTAHQADPSSSIPLQEVLNTLRSRLK